MSRHALPKHRASIVPVFAVLFACLPVAPTVASPPRAESLCWTAQELPRPPGVSSLVAIGATKDGVIVAHGTTVTEVRSFIYLPTAAYGLSAGWTDLGLAVPLDIPIGMLSPDGRSYAGFSASLNPTEFTLASGTSAQVCGIGILQPMAGVTGGWTSAISTSTIAVGTMITQTPSGVTALSPFLVDIQHGFQVLSIPPGADGGAAIDVNDSGWVVGVVKSGASWRGALGNHGGLIGIEGRVRNDPGAVIESCVAVSDSLTVVANKAIGAGASCPVILRDARPDYVPTGTVDFDDLAEFVADVEVGASSADIDASGEVDDADLGEFVVLWAGAIAMGDSASVEPDPLPLYELLLRITPPNQCPPPLRSAAQARFEWIATLLVGSQAEPVDPSTNGEPSTGEADDDCRFKQYVANQGDYCGSATVNVPDFFPKCCSDHDNCYCGFDPDGARYEPGLPPPGGRKGCDDEFLRCMKAKCGRDHTCWIAQFGCEVLAGAYHLGVRWFGGGSYQASSSASDPADGGAATHTTAFGQFGCSVLP